LVKRPRLSTSADRWGDCVLTLRVFVGTGPPQGEDARVLQVAKTAAARFPGEVEVAVMPIGGEEATELGLRGSPTMVGGGTVLSVGGQLSAGRLKRYLEAQLGHDGLAVESAAEE
jgi:hypothetical protein